MHEFDIAIIAHTVLMLLLGGVAGWVIKSMRDDLRDLLAERNADLDVPEFLRREV